LGTSAETILVSLQVEPVACAEGLRILPTLLAQVDEG
jgi:hypothetical protein